MTYKDITKLENCPECGTNWVDQPIPEKYRENYSAPYFYSRVVGVEMIDEDFISYFQCPDCNHQFPQR